MKLTSGITVESNMFFSDLSRQASISSNTSGAVRLAMSEILLLSLICSLPASTVATLTSIAISSSEKIFIKSWTLHMEPSVVLPPTSLLMPLAFTTDGITEEIIGLLLSAIAKIGQLLLILLLSDHNVQEIRYSHRCQISSR